MKTKLLFLTLSFLSLGVNAQDLVGKWEMENDDGKIMFCENQDVYVYMFEEDLWITGTYLATENTISLTISYEGEVENSVSTYTLNNERLTITLDGYTDVLIRSDFPDPPNYKLSNASPSKLNGADKDIDQLILKSYKKYKLDLAEDISVLNLKYLSLGKESELIFSKDRGSLVINVEKFESEIGAKIVGAGKSGAFISQGQREKMRHNSDIANLVYSISDCSQGLNGSDGIQGYNGSSGCVLTINAKEIKIQQLYVELTGGSGQDGQAGQNGGNGGNGSCFCSGGNGGTGGMGGYGGHGGNGGNFKLKYQRGFGSQNITVNNRGGFGGMPGVNGLPGKGGLGAYYCQNYHSYNGMDGNVIVYQAKRGIDGMKGSVTIEKGK